MDLPSLHTHLKREQKKVRNLNAKKEEVILFTNETLTVTNILLTTVVLIVRENWFLSVSTSDVLKRWTFIGNYFNCVVLNASGHGAVAQNKGFILLIENGSTTVR